MKTKNVFWAIAMLSATGCASGTPIEEPTPVSSANSDQALTIIDCQKQLTTCTLSARSLLDIANCSKQYTTCSKQAAADLAQQTLLSGCLSKVNGCLSGAVTLSDITACRDVYTSCTSGVQGALDLTLKSAISAAKAAIAKTVSVATDLISTAGGTVADGLNAVKACQDKALACVAGATSLSSLNACEDTLNVCVGGAVDLADKVIAAVPVPPVLTTLSQSFTDCQTASQSCLAGAVTAADISSCKAVLQACVGDATTVAGQAATDVTNAATTVVDTATTAVTQTAGCADQAAQCLLSFSNPLDCATKTTQCLVP